MSQPTGVSDVSVNGFVLSVTTRMQEGDTLQLLQALTTNTISAWLWIAECVSGGVWDYNLPIDSVEEKYAKTNDITLAESFGDARVTVWATYRSQNAFRFMLNSNDRPQDAVTVHVAHVGGIEHAIAKWHEKHPQQNAPQSAQDAPNPVSTPPQGTHTPPPPANPVEGAIVATRLPTPSTPQYADGQLVSFTIVKIEAGADKGSAIFKLWSSLGGKYSTLMVYKLDTKGQPKKDYELIAPIINALGLSFEKPEASGTWRAIVRAAHADKDGKTKEYLNLVSFTPI